MKIVLFCCLIAIAYCNPDRSQTTQRRASLSRRKSNVVMKKVSEVAPAGYRSASRQEDNCAKNCIAKADESMSSDAALVEYLDKQSSPYRFEGQFKPDAMTKLCSIYNTTATCMAPCPTNAAKEEKIQALSIVRYKCAESNFWQHAQCYFDVNNEMLAACNSKCAARKTALQTDLDREMQSIADVDRLLTSMCEYLDCDSDCEHAKAIEKCGADAASVLQGYYKKTVDNLRASLAEKGFNLPNVCNKVGRSDADE